MTGYSPYILGLGWPCKLLLGSACLSWAGWQPRLAWPSPEHAEVLALHGCLQHSLASGCRSCSVVGAA